MQLGKAIVGAIIGAALGIGLLVLVYKLGQIDKTWMAIPVALLTGLGVRSLVSTYGHASYLRGALTGLFALGAFYGGTELVKTIAEDQAANAKAATLPNVAAPPLEGVGTTETGAPADPAMPADPSAPPADATLPPVASATATDATKPADAAATDATKAADEAAASATPPAQPAATPIQNAADKKPKVVPAQKLNPIDFVWLAVAGLIAYQLGRGSAADPRAGQPVVQPPDAT